MSAIALQSSGSGAGTLSIAAPITATNRTLTLPDETGTFVTSGSSTYLTSKIQPITASVASSALTVTLNPTVLDFRATPLTSGTVNTRTVSAAISVVVSSGSTLGTVSAQQSRIVVLALDNSGTIELAVVNISGGTNLDETTLISTTAEGGAGAADSATVVYSTTARTSLPFRVVGYVESTQATAGTWATAPSTIQGYGGQALAAMSSLGYGQTWQSVTGSRALATTYYNTTGRPILLSIATTESAAGGNSALTVDAIVVSQTGQAYGAVIAGTHVSVVKPGGTYSLAHNQGASTTTFVWSELR
jgi:hypothetical protein